LKNVHAGKGELRLGIQGQVEIGRNSLLQKLNLPSVKEDGALESDNFT
jgi:hypothetical protein